VGRISAEMQERMLRLLLALSEERSEEAAKIAVELGERTDDFDPERFAATAAGLATRLQRTRLADVEVGRTVLELVHQAAEAGLRMPTELALLGKTLLQLDQIGRALDPEFDPNAAVRRHAVEITTARARTGFTSASVMAGVNDLRELLRRMPDRVGKILDRIANNELEVKVNALDEKLLMAGFQKVANRIAVGLVLAALIVGAAMLVQVPTSFRIWGYPGLPMLFFLAAAAGGIALVVSIVRHDLPSRKKPPPSAGARS
jgi:predicted unusual protein kinase regulating ubiquinone biosynthesis (AarF/ABC1/UbiB family)